MKRRTIAIALLLATMAWVAAVSYAYAQIQVPHKEPTSPRAHLCAEPGDCFIQAYPVSPTANESQWLWTYYIKGELAYNESFIGSYVGEFEEPLHPYVKDAIENLYYLICFTEDEWTSVPIEEPQTSLGYQFSIYKYNATYYAFNKEKTEMFIDLFGTPEELWAIRNSQSIGPVAGISGIFLTGCWIALGAFYIKKKVQT